MTDADQPPNDSDAEFGPLLATASPRAEPDGAGPAFRRAGAPAVEQRRRFPLLAVGAAIGAAVIGVAIGQTMSRPRAMEERPTAAADTAKGDQGLQISVQTKTVEPVPAPGGQVDPMPTPVMEEPAQTIIGPAPRQPQPSAAKQEPAELAASSPAAAPSVRRYTSAPPLDPACAYAAADPASGCTDESFVQADRELYDAYAAARNAGVPARVLRRDQQDWRNQGAEAATRSRSALLDAYRDRTDSVWAMIEEWQGDEGDRRFGRR